MEDDWRYESLVESSEKSTIHYSLKYRDLLRVALFPAQDAYLGAFQGESLVAALPLFRANGPLGAVYNSLPFYGSHGGLVFADDVYNREAAIKIKSKLILQVQEEGGLSCTVVDPLFLGGSSEFDAPTWINSQERISQFNFFPSKGNLATKTVKLLDELPSKRRWDVRKAEKYGFTVMHSGSDQAFHMLEALHLKSMSRLGGVPKSTSFFKGLREVFVYDEDYRIYLAMLDGEVVSALLVMYFKNTVEYFLPATKGEFLSHQPMSLLIYKAMEHAFEERNSTLWNWGGTWKTQGGVYGFKKGWGASEARYNYWTFVNREDEVRRSSIENYLRWYPYFFVYPFEKLSEE